jgi:hypothetical protein
MPLFRAPGRHRMTRATRVAADRVAADEAESRRLLEHLTPPDPSGHPWPALGEALATVLTQLAHGRHEVTPDTDPHRRASVHVPTAPLHVAELRAIAAPHEREEDHHADAT